MEYLSRKKQTQKSRMHIWTGTDTACRMASTGGLRLSKYMVLQGTRGQPICKNCLNVLENAEVKVTSVKPELIGRIPREPILVDEEAELEIIAELQKRFL